MSSNAAASAVDYTVTPAELQRAHLFIQQSRDGIVGALKGLSEAQWKFKPAPDRWSIAEVVEHVIFVQEIVAGPVRAQLAAAPAGPANRDCQLIDAVVVNQFPNRLTKFPAPPIANPTGAYTLPEALDRLARSSAVLAEQLDSTPDLRQHAIPAAPLKAVSQGAHELMDGYQWILAAHAHTERHTKQILEVKADANFPAN